MTLILKLESDTPKMEECMQGECNQHDVRKRKRADYSKLSPDERNLKRKLKNRMSAQQARDRKKVYVTELEERIAQLEEENNRLRRICSMQLRGTDDSAVISGPLPWALLLLQLLVQVSPHKNRPSSKVLAKLQRLLKQKVQECQPGKLTSLFSKVCPLKESPGQPPPILGL